MKYLRVPNLADFQHYKDRTPPWIKLHNSILEDYEFTCLTDQGKYHLIAIWLLASRTNNRIPYDSKWISRKIEASGKVDLEVLIDYEFLEITDNNQELQQMEQDASAEQADCYREERREEERESREEESTYSDKSLSASDKSKAIPYQKIVDLYHSMLPSLPACRKLTAKRKAQIRARWLSGDIDGMDGWESYFKAVSRSDFLMGKTQPTNGRKAFMADLEWITNESNFTKIWEGKYHAK